jgi:hypothetical protein
MKQHQVQMIPVNLLSKLKKDFLLKIRFSFCSCRYFGDMTINPSPPSLPNTVPTTVPSNPATFAPIFTNTQYPIPPPPLSSAQQQQSPPPPTTTTANLGPTGQSPSAIPPPIMPPFNFALPNPPQQQQQHQPQQQYFQPVPTSLFTDFQQQQQQQQPPFQFNPTLNPYPNTFNAFSAPPPPSSIQQASHISPFANDHHGHSHDQSDGHGHSHDHSDGHGHSHDHH